MARTTLDPLLNELVRLKGSDLYLTVGFPASVRVTDRIVKVSDRLLTNEDIVVFIEEILTEEQREEYYSTMEFNMPLAWDETARFRINIFRQQQHPGIVIRRIQTAIPTLEELRLPGVYSDLIMEKRGLVLVVGPTGSGKTTSLAAMIGHRNEHGYGHIVTIEDPIEFVHQHKGCIITQRDVGTDTFFFGMALRNVLRQRPDVVLIGEMRDRETVEHALHFAETGHLCVGTLHAGNCYQAMEHILNFFPEEKHNQMRHNLAQNLRGILAQHLVLTRTGGRALAIEVMLNRGHIRNLIQENKMKEIAEIMAKNRNEGMQTFDQALLELYAGEVITEDVAITEAENPANVRLQIRSQQNSKRGGKFGVAPVLKPTSNSAF